MTETAENRQFDGEYAAAGPSSENDNILRAQSEYVISQPCKVIATVSRDVLPVLRPMT
jgi:hypothetical protein